MMRGRNNCNIGHSLPVLVEERKISSKGYGVELTEMTENVRERIKNLRRGKNRKMNCVKVEAYP